MYDRNVFYSMDFLQILWLWSTGDDKLLKAKKNQQRLKGWTWWQIKHGYNGNFDQRFICGCKHYLIIVGVISFEVYIKKKGEHEICCLKCKYSCHSHCIADRGLKC